MRLAFITDEATQSLAEAIDLALLWWVQGVELRSVEDTPIDRASPEQLSRWKAMLDDAGLRVCNLASSFYKCAQAEAEGELTKLQRLCDAADALDCDTIRGFAFFAPPSGPEVTARTLALFEGPADILKTRGKRLLLEADPSVNTTNHRALAALLSKLPREQFGAIYDPGNDLYDPFGETPYPDGYEAVKPYLAHVHIKDAVRNERGEPACVRVGTGAVDYPGLLRALREDGYDGWLSLETHYRVGAAISEELMKRPQGSAFTEGGLAATAESLESLRELMKEAGL